MNDAPRYLPFDAGRFRLMMGLMPLAPAEWIEIDSGFTADLARKRKLLATRHTEVFAALPEAATAANELLDILGAHLPRHHPEIFRREGDRLMNALTGDAWDLGDLALHPLDCAGRLVQEDFCILHATGGPYELIGATLCSPARWRLADKIGRPLEAIHDPVPGYGESLGKPVDRFFAALRPERLVWRLNWGIMDDPEPFQPTAPDVPVAISAENAGERSWLRVERQTLRRLPVSSAVVFSIRTHITRLDAAIRTPASAADLAGAIRAMPPAMQAYKRIAPIAAALLAWLEARSL